jgi:hypothetical protein
MVLIVVVFPSLKSLTVFVRIFYKSNLISFWFHVCVYFVYFLILRRNCIHESICVHCIHQLTWLYNNLVVRCALLMCC